MAYKNNTSGTSLIDDFFRDPFFREPFPHDLHRPPHDNPMKTNIYETPSMYFLEIELAGFSRSDIIAELEKGYLTITAKQTKHVEEGPEHMQLVHRERFDGPYKRSFYVGEEVRQEDVKAAYTDGILKLTIPKKDKKKIEENRFIAIE